ncbi:uncharacterized protein LOC141901818 [Tubulanus polymorphus]|uniref:uncharacterized protein LOC141901818 n=1 Tax=Tubulanus polymorphus TaxID=672921 RepID=UPI003DA211A7
MECLALVLACLVSPVIWFLLLRLNFRRSKEINKRELADAISRVTATGRFARELACHEIGILNENDAATGHSWAIFSFVSEVDLPVTTVQTSLRHIYRRHPILRAKISKIVTSKNTVMKFIEEMEEETIVFRQSAATDYRTLADEDLVTVFDENGPLWKITMLQSVKAENDDESKKYTFVAVGLHLIFDGTSVVTFVKDFIKILDYHLSNEKSVTDVESVPLKPSRDYYMESDIKLTMRDRVRFYMNGLYRHFRPKPAVDLTSKLNLVPEENCGHGELKRTIEYIEIDFDEAETAQMVAATRAKGLRVNAPIVTIAATALTKMLEEKQIPAIQNVIVQVIANLRYPRICTDITKRDLGDYTTRNVYNIDIPIPAESDRSTFWEVARNTQREIEHQLNDLNLLFESCKTAKLISRDPIARSPPYIADLIVTNWGSFDVLKNANLERPIRDARIHLFYNNFDTRVSPFTIIVATIDGRLSFNVQYQTDDVGRDFALKYAEMIRKLFLECCHQGDATRL